MSNTIISIQKILILALLNSSSLAVYLAFQTGEVHAASEGTAIQQSWEGELLLGEDCDETMPAPANTPVSFVSSSLLGHQQGDREGIEPAPSEDVAKT